MQRYFIGKFSTNTNQQLLNKIKFQYTEVNSPKKKNHWTKNTSRLFQTELINEL